MNTNTNTLNEKRLARVQTLALQMCDAIRNGQRWQDTIEDISSLLRAAKRVNTCDSRVWHTVLDLTHVANNAYADGQTGLLAREFLYGKGIADVLALQLTADEIF